MCKWISVEDKLPEQDTEVLLYSDYEGEYIGYLVDGDFYNMDDIVYDATHWMPLPDPPHSCYND